jgi:hypothetical protein
MELAKSSLENVIGQILFFNKRLQTEERGQVGDRNKWE